MKMTLSHHYLDANLDILEKLGFPKTRALRVLGLDEARLSSHMDRLDIDLFVDCINAAADFISDPYIALRLGLKFRVGGLGDTGSIYSFCEDLKEVMTMHNLYQKAAIDTGRIKYIQKLDGSHHLCFIPHYADWSRYRVISDMLMASYVTTYRWLSWGGGEDIVCTRLPYINASEQAEYETLLQTRVELKSEDICLEFSEHAMSQKLTTRNPERLARKRMTLDKLIGKQTATDDFEKAVEAAIRGAIRSGQVSAQVVADRMGMSWSALRTQLKASGEGMRPRLERIRKDMFIEKHNAGQSFSQIAMSLAYNDQAAMNRAFKRWFGMTPTKWQKQHTKEKA